MQSSPEPTLVQVSPHAACPCGGRREGFWAKHFTYKHILHFHVVLICCLKAPTLSVPSHVSTRGTEQGPAQTQNRDWKQKKPGGSDITLGQQGSVGWHYLLAVPQGLFGAKAEGELIHHSSPTSNDGYLLTLRGKKDDSTTARERM